MSKHVPLLNALVGYFIIFGSIAGGIEVAWSMWKQNRDKPALAIFNIAIVVLILSPFLLLIGCGVQGWFGGHSR